MTDVDIRQFEQEFVIHFGSGRPAINAYTLASSLVSIADAVKEANSILNPGYEVEVVVEALGRGSFKAKVRTVYKGLGNLFSKENLKAIALGVIAAYVYQNTLAPDAAINVTVNEDLVVIEQGDQKIVIPRETHDALKHVERSEKFRRDVGRTFTALEQDKEITSIGIAPTMEDPAPPLRIPRERFGLVPRELANDGAIREVVEIANLQIVRAILQRSNRRWEFVWRGIKIPAPVLDEHFYAEFSAHRITIAPGDALKVKLKISQAKDHDTGIFTNTRYEVIEVLEHVPRVEQSDAGL
jgi:hypothetical protein